MIIKNQLRPTMIRTNSRYRGQTEAIKFTNFMQEAAHDVKLLGTFMDTNEVTDKLGHSDYIYNNFAKFVEGTDGEIKSNISSASVLCHPTDDAFSNLNLLSSAWVTHGNCVKGGSQTKPTLQSPGTADPCGITAQLLVEEGDIIYIRMGVKLLSGDATAFTLGSDDITNGEIVGDLTKFNIPLNGSIIYIDKRLYCKHREAINVVIDVHRLPGTLKAGKVELIDVEIKYMTEHNVAIKSSNSILKPGINLLGDRIQNIVDHM